MKIVNTDKAPEAIGPYSQAVKIDGIVYCSGQIPLDPETGKIVEGGIEEQTHQVMKNLGAVLEAAGGSFDSLLKTTIFLTNMGTFSLVNEIYGSYLSEPYPARATIEVSALPKGALVEVEAVARVA